MKHDEATVFEGNKCPSSPLESRECSKVATLMMQEVLQPGWILRDDCINMAGPSDEVQGSNTAFGPDSSKLDAKVAECGKNDGHQSFYVPSLGRYCGIGQ